MIEDRCFTIPIEIESYEEARPIFLGENLDDQLGLTTIEAQDDFSRQTGFRSVPPSRSSRPPSAVRRGSDRPYPTGRRGAPTQSNQLTALPHLDLGWRPVGGSLKESSVVVAARRSRSRGRCRAPTGGQSSNLNSNHVPLCDLPGRCSPDPALGSGAARDEPIEALAFQGPTRQGSLGPRPPCPPLTPIGPPESVRPSLGHPILPSTTPEASSTVVLPSAARSPASLADPVRIPSVGPSDTDAPSAELCLTPPTEMLSAPTSCVAGSPLASGTRCTSSLVRSTGKLLCYRRSLRLAAKYKDFKSSSLQKAQDLKCKKINLALPASTMLGLSPSISSADVDPAPTSIPPPKVTSHVPGGLECTDPKDRNHDTPLTTDEILHIKTICGISVLEVSRVSPGQMLAASGPAGM